VFFECDWFDPVNGTRVDDFGMVEMKHELHYLGNNLLFAHQAQQLYYLSYPHESMKHWWVVYKVNPEMDTHRYNHYIYIFKYVIKEINLLFFKCVHMFYHKSKGKGRKGDSLSSS
jgi:hypothetical protein